MNEISRITGRKYGLFNYYGDPEADRVIILMGSATEAAREAIDYLREEKGEKVGLVSVHLYRPFSVQQCPRRQTESLCLTARKNLALTANLSTST